MIRVPCSKTLARRILRGSLLEVNKYHLLNQTRLDLVKLYFMSRPSTSALVNYNDKRKSKDWHYRTFESSREQVRLTQIRNVHEIGEMKRAQEYPADEVCEQVNSMNDSGDFQDVEYE